MKKVLLTVLLVTSFGGSLQAFSLKGFFEGLGHMLGIPPGSHYQNFEIVNDLSTPMSTGYKKIIGFMGGFFPAAVTSRVKVFQPYQSTLEGTTHAKGETSHAIAAYKEVPYYFAWYMSQNTDSIDTNPFFKKYYLSLNKEHDPTIHYYHAYEAHRYEHGQSMYVPTAEIFGSFNPQAHDAKHAGSVQIVDQLDMLEVYNNTPEPVTVEYDLEGQKYVHAELAAYTWGYIRAPENKSLRPGKLRFKNESMNTPVQVPIAAHGPKGKKPVIEIYEKQGSLHAAVQGFAAGNYRQQTVRAAQDLTPQTCVLWYQSVKQEAQMAHKKQQQPEKHAYDLPGQVWMAYKDAGHLAMKHIQPGQAQALTVNRPQSDHTLLYFFYVPTGDEKTAQYFVHQAITGKSGYNVIHDFEQKVHANMTSLEKIVNSGTQKASAYTAHSNVADVASKEDLQKALAGDLAIATPKITVSLPDSQGDLTGFFLGGDIFMPVGSSHTTYYYVLQPSVFIETSLVTKIKHMLNAGLLQKHGMDKKLSDKMIEWVTEYTKSPDKVAQDVQAFILKYGQSTMVNQHRTGLQSSGIMHMKSLLYGKVSISNPPILYRAVLSYFPSKKAPQDMPDIIKSSNPPTHTSKAK